MSRTVTRVLIATLLAIAAAATCGAAAGTGGVAPQVVASADLCHLRPATFHADAHARFSAASSSARASPSPSPVGTPRVTLCVSIMPLAVSRPGRAVFYAWIVDTGHAVGPVTITASAQARGGARVLFTHCPAGHRAKCEIRRARSRRPVWMRIRLTPRRAVPGMTVTRTHRHHHNHRDGNSHGHSHDHARAQRGLFAAAAAESGRGPRQFLSRGDRGTGCGLAGRRPHHRTSGRRRGGPDRLGGADHHPLP